MSERDLFLRRLRSRLARDVREDLSHPLVTVDEVPPIRYEQDLSDPVVAFTRNATMQGAQVERVQSLSDFLRGVVDDLVARTAVVSGDPEAEGAAPVLERLGVDVLGFDGPRADADLGVVGAAWGIAATGTVVFDASRAVGRSASLLPPAIAVVLRLDRILPDSGELFRRMPERFPSGLPSQVVLETGPSKSGDIELELTTGVHGPGQVWIGLVG